MNRRSFLFGAAGAGVVLSGGAGLWIVSEDDRNDGRASAKPVEDPPEKVASAKPLAEAFHAHITEFYPDARVFITRRGTLAMEYPSEAESREGLLTEFNQIATEYSDVIQREEAAPTTLSIVASEVQAIVVESALQAHHNGEINQEAFLETIEVTGVERRTARRTE